MRIDIKKRLRQRIEKCKTSLKKLEPLLKESERPEAVKRATKKHISMMKKKIKQAEKELKKIKAEENDNGNR